MIGRFHEISLATGDIRATIAFYETLRFTQATTNDTWPHRYGVLHDGNLFLGVHERRMPSPALSFVLPDVAAHVAALERRGVAISARHLGADEFNYVTFADPGSQTVCLLEARTFSPPREEDAGRSLCGEFEALSLPERDLEQAAAFWQGLGLEAEAGDERAWPSVRLRGPGLTIELHRSRTADVPLLIFSAPDMAARIEALRALELGTEDPIPRGLDPAANALIEAPEGLALLLLTRS